MGFTSTYSCDGLADKLRKILIASGARSDVKSVPGACASGFGRPDKFARADLTFYTLAPAATVTAATGAPPGATVKGVWRPVTLANRSPFELTLGDCELVDQFRAQVLPKFTTMNVQNRTSCIPYQLSGSMLNLSFDVLTAPPAAPHAAAASPPYQRP